MEEEQELQLSRIRRLEEDVGHARDMLDIRDKQIADLKNRLKQVCIPCCNCHKFAKGFLNVARGCIPNRNL